MKHLIVIYIIIIVAGLGNSVFSQKMKIKIDSREVVLNYADSTVKANITLKEKKYKPKTNQVYYWYKSNEIKKNLGGYTGRLLNGKYTTYDLNRNMITEGYFEDGVKTNTWKRWFPKGGLQKIEQYKDGKKDGEFIFYNHNGQLISVINYKNGLLNGKYTEYIDDTVYCERNYKKGKEIVAEVKIKEEKDTEKSNNNKKTKEKIEKDTDSENTSNEEPEKDKKVTLTKEEKQALKQKKKAEKEAEKEKRRLEQEKEKKQETEQREDV